MPDFEGYYRFGARALHAEPLYRPEDGHFQNKYLPVFAVAAAPLALLPLTAAKTVWFFLSVAALAGLVTASLRLVPDRRTRPWVLALLTTLAMAKFYLHELNLGQCNAAMTLFVVAAFGSLWRTHPTRAGAWLAGAVVVKPYALLFLPYWLWARRPAAFAAAAAFVAAALLLPSVLYGPGGNVAQFGGWVATVTDTTAPNLLNQDNVSVWAMYAKWLGTGPAATALAAATIVVLLLIVAVLVRWGRGLTRPEYLDMAVLLTLVPLISPQGWDYGLLAATPAVLLFFDRSRDLPRAPQIAGWVAIVVMGAGLFDLMGRRAYAAFMATSAITVCALALVGVLAVVRVRRLA